MLFPLDKSFCSSRFYQSGGSHEEPVRRCPYTIDHAGSSERTLELHRLLVDQKPFKAHKQVIMRRAEEGRIRDCGFRREHNEHIKSVQADLDEKAGHERQALKRRIREHREQRSSSDAALASTMTAQKKDYTDWRNEMEAKVRAMPPLCGDPPAPEDRAVTHARAEARKKMVQSSKDYKEKQQGIKDALDQRSPSVPILRGPKADHVIEKKKASGLLALSKQHREYESHLEDLYDRHEDRKQDNLHQTRQAIADANVTRREVLMASMKDRSASMANSKQELADLKERVNGKHKPFAGYVAMHKSDKRLREELAHRDIAAASGGFSGGRSNGGERTLSPRALGLNQGSG